MKPFPTIFFFLLFALFLKSLNAQYIGTKGGVNISTFYSNDVLMEYSPSFGINSSVFYKKTFFSFLSIRPELGFYQKGSQLYINNVKSTITFNYSQMGFDVQLQAPQVPFYVFGNIYGNYLMSGESKTLNDTTILSIGKNYYLPYDYGIAGGVGFNFDFPFFSIFIEGKYEFGLFDFNDYTNADLVEKNRNLVVSFGFMVEI